MELIHLRGAHRDGFVRANWSAGSLSDLSHKPLSDPVVRAKPRENLDFSRLTIGPKLRSSGGEAGTRLG